MEVRARLPRLHPARSPPDGTPRIAVVTVWTAIVPVKRFAAAKSRLEDAEVDRAALARAVALDTIAAVAATPSVQLVLVVTDGAAFAPDVLPASARIIQQSAPGLNGAVVDGVVAARGEAPDRSIVALLGDLPCLTPATLESVLISAAAHPLGLVPDAVGTGTTMITAMPGVVVEPAFGADSAARHRALGYRHIPAPSPARRDVDTAQDLVAALRLGVGPNTTALLAT